MKPKTQTYTNNLWLIPYLPEIVLYIKNKVDSSLFFILTFFLGCQNLNSQYIRKKFKSFV